MTPLLLTFAQVAEILDADRGHLEVLVRRGAIPATTPYGLSGKAPLDSLRFRPSLIRRLIARLHNPTAMVQRFKRIAYKEAKDARR